MPDDLPSYHDLPVRSDAPPRSSWGLWGDDDRLGALNLLTRERVVAAADEIRTGSVFPLDLPMELIDPPLYGRARYRHTVLGEDDGPGHDELIDSFNTQSSTQWDGFRHIRHGEHGWYGGAPEGTHGVHYWAARGIAGRAVVADVARWREHVGRPLTPDAADPIDVGDLTGTLEHQGSQVRTGDVLLVRTGWVGWYRTLDPDARRDLAAGHASCGLLASRDMAELLWDLHVAAVAADNPALEAWPPSRPWLHPELLPLLGIPIGELFDLDSLAADCAIDSRWSCFLTSAPLHLPLGVASPPNALAIR
jgi:hypothetical protein